MKICRCKWIFFLVCLALCPIQTYGESKGKNQIKVSAQSLVADDAKKYAEFIGNVKAVQGDTVIYSDKLRIVYKAGQKSEAGKPSNAIQKIIAEGNVKIIFDDMTAEGQKAVYTTKDRIMVMSGSNAKVTRKKSGTISGSKITVHRDSGRIKFEGGVQGVFFPADGGLN